MNFDRTYPLWYVVPTVSWSSRLWLLTTRTDGATGAAAALVDRSGDDQTAREQGQQRTKNADAREATCHGRTFAAAPLWFAG